MNTRTRLKSIVSVTLIMTLICVILLTLALFLSFDEKLGYFANGSLPSLFKAFYTVTLAYIAISCFVYLKKRLIYAETNDISRTFQPLWIAVGAVAGIYAISDLIISALNGSLAHYGMLSSSNAFLLVALSSLGALSLGAYLIYSAIRPAVPYDPAKVVLVCLSALFPIGVMMKNHFNVVRTVNSVENVLSVFAACALLLYICSEAKRNIYRRVDGLYFASLFISFFALACLSVSYIIAFIGGAVKDSDRLRDAVFMLVIALHLACVVIRAFSFPDESSPENS